VPKKLRTIMSGFKDGGQVIVPVPVHVTRFFEQSLPKFFSNFTKLRNILPNVGFPNNYVIVMPKNNSYVIKVENICPKFKKVSRNTCCFHHIAVFANDKDLFLRLGSSVHHV
jgi:hypothetical protein